MKKSKFTESQIIGMIKRHEKGDKVADICRDHGISQGTFYNWKGKYSGMEVSQLKRFKELEAEVAQYKKMYAEACLDNRVLKEVIEKSSRARRQKGTRRLWPQVPRGFQAAGLQAVRYP